MGCLPAGLGQLLASYGAADVRLWLRLFVRRMARSWRPGEQILPAGPGGFSIDSRQVRERFGLAPFTGQLFIHAIGVAGHDVVKYAMDTYVSGVSAPAPHCPAPMMPMHGPPIGSPACLRRARTKKSFSGYRTATLYRFRREQSRSTAWGRSSRFP